VRLTLLCRREDTPVYESAVRRSRKRHDFEAPKSAAARDLDVAFLESPGRAAAKPAGGDGTLDVGV
jgi:hypothetical protein